MPEGEQLVNQEIADLERQLAEKRASLGYTENTPEEKEALREVIGEQIQQHAPSYQPQASVPVQSQPAADDQASYLSPELKDKVQELINIAFNQSLENGIKAAADLKNPAIMDAFHDVITDQLYDLLIERKKIEAP